MDDGRELLPSKKDVVAVTAHRGAEELVGQTLVTSDHDVIRHWAQRRQAEPATGEQTSSGPATVNVNDGGAGIRFNFPSAGHFRPIAWNEWFENFDRHRLVFVYEEYMPDGNVSMQYRIVKSADLDRHVL